MSDTVDVTVETTATTTDAVAAFVTDYRTGDKHAGNAALLRGKAVNRALMTEGVTLDMLADALTATEGKVSKATLSNYGRAYRTLRDAGIDTRVNSDGSTAVGRVLAAINRGATGALNDWEKQVRPTQTWDLTTFTAAIDALQKRENSRTGKRKGEPDTPTVTAEGATERPSQTPASAQVEPTVDLDRLADTITAVDLAELLSRIATRRTFSEGETASLFAGMTHLTDSLEHADDTAATLTDA